MIIFIILCFVLIALAIAFANRTNYYYRPVGFPPGPAQLPLVGNLLFFRKSPLKALMTWKREYGNIVGVRLGQSRVVIISDYNLIKEALNNVAFNARPNFIPPLLFAGGENHGTLTSAGDSWDIIRRFTIKNLNQLNFGREGMESFMQEDISRLIIELKKEDGKLVDFKDKFYLPIINHLWIILTGIEIPENKRSDFQNALVKLNRCLWKPIGSSIWFMPWLTEFLPSITGLRRLKKAFPTVHSFVKNRFEEHIADGFHHSGDLMSAFFAEIDKAVDDSKSPFYKQTGRDHMQGTIVNLFVTAAETLTNILNWSLLYLSLYPEVQETLYQEILNSIGSSRMPTLTDQSNMPYTKVVIQELLRISSTSPFANFHETVKNVQFHGYLIPKGTVVIASLYGIHHDQKIWGDPECFRPERFLPQDLQQIKNNNLKDKTFPSVSAGNTVPPVIPFSVGLRTCLGQTFARKEIFMFLVSLCQKFEFSWDPTVPKPSQEELTVQSHVSVFRFTMPFQLVVTTRRND